MARRNKKKNFKVLRISRIYDTSPRLRFSLMTDPYNSNFVNSRRNRDLVAAVSQQPRSLQRKVVVVPAAAKQERVQRRAKPYSALSSSFSKPTHHEIKRAEICARRKQRKEIMHALKHAGRGGQRKPDNTNAKVKC
jgi:hypothetical protein